MFSKACLQALVPVIMNIEEIKKEWKTRLIWTEGMFTGYVELLTMSIIMRFLSEPNDWPLLCMMIIKTTICNMSTNSQTFLQVSSPEMGGVFHCFWSIFSTHSIQWRPLTLRAWNLWLKSLYNEKYFVMFKSFSIHFDYLYHNN